MRKPISTTIVLAVLAILAVLGILHIQQGKPDYSYQAYVQSVHMESQSCDLSTTVTCKGTHRLPTRSQTVLWSSYVLWHSCNASHDTLACQALND